MTAATIHHRARWRQVVRMLAMPVLAVLASALLCPARSLAQQIPFVSYGAESGLPNLGLTCLAQDRNRFMLLCTENGVARFDGTSFTRFGPAQGLPDRGLSHHLSVTPDGHLFVFDRGDLFTARDTINPVFRRVHGVGGLDNDTDVRTALLGSTLVMQSHGILRTVEPETARVLPLLSAGQLQQHPALRAATVIAAGADTVWLGCGDGRLCRMSCPDRPTAEGLERCGAITEFGPEAGVERGEWLALLVARDGTLWARSANRLISLAPGARRFTDLPVPGGIGRYIGRESSIGLIEGPSGEIATQGPAGLLTLRKGRFLEYGRAHGLMDGVIASMLLDRDGSLWLAMRGQGLLRAVGFGRWQNWTTADGLLDDGCWQLARPPGGPLYVATDGGIDAVTANGPRGGAGISLASPAFAVAATPSGKLWVADLVGVLQRLDPATGRIDARFSAPMADFLGMDRAGNLLIASRAGMLRVTGADGPAPSAPALIAGTAGRIRTFTQAADGSIWAVSAGDLLRIDPTGSSPPVVILPRIDADPRTLLFVRPDELWIGSDRNGLQRLLLRQGEPAALLAVDHPLLSVSQIESLYQDVRGWIWVGTDHGVAIWNGRDWAQINRNDGLISNDLNEGSILGDPDGSIWFGTGQGLSHLLDPASMFPGTLLHPVITETRLNDKPFSGGSIGWSRARLTVRFSALDYAFTHAVRFRYRLRGVDEDWVETSDTTVRYPTLPPGRLVFEVAAVEPNHRRISEPVSFAFTVRPPPWDTLPFRAAVLLLLVAGATAIWRLRIRLLLHRQRQLELLVASRTAEIERAHAALKQQASRDSLTGLLNRAALSAQLETLVGTQAPREALALAMVDFDHFKTINDRYGHLGGDMVLQEVCRRLIDALRPGEHAGRFGGEELVILLTGKGARPARLEEIRRAMIAEPVRIDGAPVAISCSFGLVLRRATDDAETLLRRADHLLYQAKAEGRDRIVSCDDLSS